MALHPFSPSESSMIIRDANEEDLPALLEIHNDAIRTLDAIWLEHEETLAERQNWFIERRAAGFPVVVAVTNAGEILGYGSYGTYRAREGYRATVEHSVYLFPQARGNGVGKALLNWLIGHARSEGFHAMVAVIDASNRISIELHEKFGFESTGVMRQVGQKRGKWLDLVQMVKLLDDRESPDADA